MLLSTRQRSPFVYPRTGPKEGEEISSRDEIERKTELEGKREESGFDWRVNQFAPLFDQPSEINSHNNNNKRDVNHFYPTKLLTLRVQRRSLHLLYTHFFSAITTSLPSFTQLYVIDYV